jgi:hypothetical protein
MNTVSTLRAFALKLREMGSAGESPYGEVDGETIVDIPAQAVKGRSGTHGKTFSGHFDMETGTFRVDCAEDPCFWLEIDTNKIPAFAAAPGGPAAQAAAAEFEEAKRQRQN